MIAAIVVGTVAALVVALGMYVAYRRRRSAAHRPRKGMAAARQALQHCLLSSHDWWLVAACHCRYALPWLRYGCNMAAYLALA